MRQLQRLMLSTLSHIKNNDIDVVLGKARCLNVISYTDHAPLETQVGDRLIMISDLANTQVVDEIISHMTIRHRSSSLSMCAHVS